MSIQKVIILYSGRNESGKNVTSWNNKNLESISECKLTEISRSQMVTDKNNAERISVCNNEQKVMVESDSKQSQMSTTDNNESFDNKKLVSILKHVNKNTKPQSSAKKRSIGNAENNTLKMTSSFKPVQKNKVIFILGPKKKKHTASDQDCSNDASICGSNNSFSLNSGTLP